MDSFLAPQNALVSPLLWVATTGPDQGQVLPVKRGILGRFSGLSDPKISREALHLETSSRGLRLLPFPNSAPVYKLWKTRPFHHRIRRATRLKPGQSLLLGQTTLRLAPRPQDLRLNPPPKTRSFGGRNLLFLVLPLLLMFGLGVFLGWRLLVVLGLVGLGAGIFLIHRARQVPSLEKLWLAAATPRKPPNRPEPLIRVFTGKKLHHRTMEITAGETLCFTGLRGAEQARWVIAQAILFGQARLSPHNDKPWQGEKPRDKTIDNQEKTLMIRVVSTPVTPDLADNEVCFTIATDTTPPAWAGRILNAGRKTVPASESWFASLLQALEQNPQGVNLETPAEAENLPRTVGAELLGDTDENAIRARWDHPHRGLEATLGITKQDQIWKLDLVEEGPHALIAGTTGSGKSELLTTWLISLALNYSPQDLRFILVDYKGGAAFGTLEGLPHTHGVLTDLAPQMTARALTSLEAFLKERETTLAGVQARDLEHYRVLTGKKLARVLIVVDEFRALATDHPETLENLIRLATHGRSLGLHLILATQKPGGVVNGQILANTNLRVALRVRSPQESTDILGDSRAASLPPIPGRLYWEGNIAGVAQAAWCGGADWVQRTVDTIRRTWEGLSDGHGLPQIWRPDLPAEIPAAPGGFALMDLPRQAQQNWRFPASTLGIFANPGTGRTTALATLAATWKAQGRFVIVVSPDLAIFERYLGSPDPRPSAQAMHLFPPDSLWQVDQLLQAAQQKDLVGMAVIIDRADLLLDRIEQLYPGQGVKRLEALLAGCNAGGYQLAFSGPLHAGRSTWGRSAGEVLVLCPRDTVDLHTAGIESAGIRGRLADVLPTTLVPGRGVWLIGNSCAATQVGLPDVLPSSSPSIVSEAGLPDWSQDCGVASRSVSWELPKNFSASEMPYTANELTLGWSSELRDWFRVSPQSRHWVVEDCPNLRPVVAQLKREYRRFGYAVVEAENLSSERIHRNTLVLMFTSEHKIPNLEVLWESIENRLDFDLTILELRSPGSLPPNLNKSLPNFTKPKVSIMPLERSLEGRHRLANSLNVSPEFLRKFQIYGDFPAIYQNGSEVGALLIPNANVRHLT